MGNTLTGSKSGKASRFHSLLGQRFGRLLVIQYDGMRRNCSFWLCACTCGNTKSVATADLKRRTRSCGCLQRIAATNKIKHGYCRARQRTPEYRAYGRAKARCENPAHKRYADWGGRGIQFKFPDFQAFFAALGPRPSKDHSVDRINNDGHYEPGNVRWATRQQQLSNRRAYKRRQK